METTLFEGDTVVINTMDKTITDNQVYAVNYEGEDVVKRLVRDNGDWWLTSDNPDQRRYPRKLCRGASCVVIG
ncbi:S24 family peptidase, partial [Salmonella enterica]|uniref:S24 family peptidase n=1 Tax=Salmonella enterica TaxID=28901 RepID=UPI003CEF83ED